MVSKPPHHLRTFYAVVCPMNGTCVDTQECPGCEHRSDMSCGDLIVCNYHNKNAPRPTRVKLPEINTGAVAEFKDEAYILYNPLKELICVKAKDSPDGLEMKVDYKATKIKADEVCRIFQADGYKTRQESHAGIIRIWVRKLP